MNGREIIKRVINFENPPRIGLMLRSEGCPKDIVALGAPSGTHSRFFETGWCRDPALLERAPGFAGQVRQDAFGNLWGRLDATSKGECIRGALQDGWAGLGRYELPKLEGESFAGIYKEAEKNAHRYKMGMLPGMPFSMMRVMRGMENFMADVLLNDQDVLALREKCMEYLLEFVDDFAACGMDGVYAGEDWGTQTALLISPACWRKLFKPCFARIVRRCHSRGMHFILHSCGYIRDIIGDLIEAGVDALQLDQPCLIGVEQLNDAFGGRVTFFCPVDIQRAMPTGDRNIIEAEARRMIRTFGGRGGGFIACDYSDWPSLGVRDEWAGWARKIFIEEGVY